MASAAPASSPAATASRMRHRLVEGEIGGDEGLRVGGLAHRVQRPRGILRRAFTGRDLCRGPPGQLRFDHPTGVQQVLEVHGVLAEAEVEDLLQHHVSPASPQGGAASGRIPAARR
ncbi:hypothetical protein OG361_34535 [Streptomyces sp. NBC_00090]